MFIKPARCCRSIPAANAAAVGAAAAAAPTLVGALLEGAARPPCAARRSRQSHAPWPLALASAQTHTLHPWESDHPQESKPMKVVPLPLHALVRIWAQAVWTLPAWGLWAMTLLAQCGGSQPCHKWRAATLPQEMRQLTHSLQCWILCDLSMLYLVMCSEFTLMRHDKLTQVTSHKHTDIRCVWQSHARQSKSTTSR